ncbi:MAG: hypothetical protein AAF639_20465 [Chloroflexota bacterium]
MIQKSNAMQPLVWLVIIIVLTVSACMSSSIESDPQPTTMVEMTESNTVANSEEADSEEADSEEADSEEVETDAPVSPLSAPESPLAAPESPLAAPEAAELPALEIVYDEGNGAVTGQLIFVDENGERPVAGVMLALSDMLKDDKGNPLIASYKRELAPRIITDEYGRFVFNQVEPETYGLILDSVTKATLLDYTEQIYSIVFDVEANGLVDFGELRYDDLPVPGYTKK